MSFYERYLKICTDRGLDPCAQKTADMFKITKATISSWNKNKTTPKGETISIIADKLKVSSDYLLERTNDPTDFTKENTKGTDLTEKEQQLLKIFRRASDEEKDTILKVATVLNTKSNIANAANKLTKKSDDGMKPFA